MNEIKRIHVIKRSMLEFQKGFEVGFLMIQKKIMRSIIHQVEQFNAFVDDGFALSPSQNRCEKS